jgi:polysaccharide biosynthesis transport protein
MRVRDLPTWGYKEFQAMNLIRVPGHELELSRDVFPFPSQASFSRDGTSLAYYWRVLLKRWTIVVSVLVVVLVSTAIVSLHAPKMYEATGRIAIYPENPGALGLKNLDTANTSDDSWDYSVALDTQVGILRSNDLALQVIRSLGIYPSANPASGQLVPAANAPLPLNTTQEAAALARFQSALKVSVVPRTRLVELKFVDRDPRHAARVVNTLSSAYIEQNFKTRFESTTQTSEWLTQQLSDLQLKVETSQQRLVEYQKAHGILGLDEKHNIITAKLDELNKELTVAEGERIQREADYRVSLSSDPESVAKLQSNSILQPLRSKEAGLNGQLAQMTTRYGPSYPKVVEVNGELAQTERDIATEIQRISSRLKGEYLAAAQRENLLRRALEQQKLAANTLNQGAIEYNELKRDVDSNRQLYENLMQKLKEAGVAAGLRSSNVRIVDAARVPQVPSSPKIPRNMALAFMLGSFAGLAMAFSVEYFDQTLSTPEDAETVSGFPCLGVIPSATQAGPQQRLRTTRYLPAVAAANGNGKMELVSHLRPKSEAAEAYRALRTSVLLSRTTSSPTVFMVSSALPQEGKTTTSINLATVLAQKSGRVLLIDADLRRPGVHRAFGIRQAPGLSELLTGSILSLSQAVVSQLPVPHLSVLPAGSSPPNPAELLSTKEMWELLAQCRTEFDYVVVDTPPMLSVTDAVVLSRSVDSVMLVIRSGQTPREALRRTCEMLTRMNINLAGLVVNDLNARTLDMKYYYGYKYYGYKYHGRYYDDSAPRK